MIGVAPMRVINAPARGPTAAVVRPENMKYSPVFSGPHPRRAVSKNEAIVCNDVQPTVGASTRACTNTSEALVTLSAPPYDLRHAFCSLLIAEGLSVVEIAQHAGHSPAMTLDTYGHVIDELAGTERRPAEDVIREARDAVAAGRSQIRRGAEGR
jgi:hypothetical protein